MIADTVFYTEKKTIQKIALLFTIPCAILPIMLSTAVFMSIPAGSLFFRYDFLVFSIVYFIYLYGLLLSFRRHRKAWLLLIFSLHLVCLAAYIFWKQSSWLSYLTILNVMATSLVNQYNRLGVFTCTEECQV